MLPPGKLKQLSSTTNRAKANIRANTLRAAMRRWERSPNYRDAEVERIVEDLQPVVRGGQQATTRLTSGYLQTATGTKAGKLVDVDKLRGDISFEEEYQRPASTVYNALAEGKTFDQARKLGAQRLFYLVATDLQLAYTHQVQQSLSNSDVSGYRRTIGSNKACALCLIASTRLYYKEELMPIHPGCQCSVEPYKGQVDEMGVIDYDTLDAVQAAVEARYGESDRNAADLGLNKKSSKGKKVSDYTDLMLVRQHGEYGPTLTWADNKFTGPNDLTRLTR